MLCGGFCGYKTFTRYIYLDKNTNLSSSPYITKSINFLIKGFDYAKKESKKENLNFDYVFYNAYGSGFIKNNPIPNDLDFAVGINLGQYEYDGENAHKIAKSLTDKIDQFKYFFSIYISLYGGNHTFVTTSPLMVLNESSLLYRLHEKAIADDLESVIIGKPYMVTTQADKNDILFPYLMNPNEILLPNSEPITLYSDLVKYDKKMPKYVREISIVPEYFFTFKYDDKTYDIEIVPEAFEGERLHLKRRFFAPNVFLNPPSKEYLSKLDLLNDEGLFVDYRLLSFRRHLQEIANIRILDTKPIKIFKRIMQTANILYPLLDKEEYEAICKTVGDSLGNRDVQLLNEYLNITGNVFSMIIETPNVFFRMNKENKVKEMFVVMENTLDELEKRGNISSQNLEKLKNFYENNLKLFLTAENSDDINQIIAKHDIINTYYQLKIDCNELIYELADSDKNINKYIKDFSEIFEKAGFKQIDLFWLDANTIGVLKDSKTKGIKDFNKLIQDNKLPIANYKLISNTQVPKVGIKYGAWVRFNTTSVEDDYYKNMVNIFKSDMKNYKIKYAK